MAAVDESLVCVPQLAKGKFVCAGSHVETGRILQNVREERGGLGGLPDVIALFSGGRIALREATSIAEKDKLRPNLHEVADTMRQLFGRRVDIALVEWDFDC